MAQGTQGESDISKEEFMAWTNGIWSFNGESKKRIGHPAPSLENCPVVASNSFPLWATPFATP
ncbi:hypothetical protein NHP21005_16390 [Helicobacter sp. NHP21005]|nr:hypothetical protein NHP21005_16390 [Helicobacter sp. NHP21005]